MGRNNAKNIKKHNDKRQKELAKSKKKVLVRKEKLKMITNTNNACKIAQ